MKNIEVQGLTISYKKINADDYISLTDIAKAKNADAPADVIKYWLRNYSTLEYIRIWESFYNPDFKLVEIDQFLADCGSNSFTMSPTKLVDTTNAISLITKAGKHGGTYAHRDIAFKFASWISVEFEFYLIKEFQRLKTEENKQLEWSAKRELTKINYRIHTDAIKEYIVPSLSPEQLNFVYANEADILNMAMFGMTATEWRAQNKDLTGNIRDYANIEQLLVLANMESYNSILIKQGAPQSERLRLLNDMAINQLKVLSNYNHNYLTAK